MNFSLYSIGFLCNRVRWLVVHDCVINTSNVNVPGKCDLLEEATQLFVHHQRGGAVKLKCGKELSSRYTKFVCYNHNRSVFECHVLRLVVIAIELL